MKTKNITCNEFLVKLLNLLATQIVRLQDPLIKLQIQIELNKNDVFEIIQYFIDISGKYKEFWDHLNRNIKLMEITQYNNSIVSINNNDINTYQIQNSREFRYLHEYLLKNKIFNSEELEWLDDAIHDILVD